jgi:osomolarity two-component system sensor histidine kinase SLN1
LNRSQGLSLTASLKAGQIASDLELLETTCGAITTRILLQVALQRFYNYNNNTEENWIHASDDIQFALSSGGYSQLLQVKVYSRNGTGDPHGLLNITADNARDILLPMFYPNSTVSVLSHPEECSNRLVLASQTW